MEQTVTPRGPLDVPRTLARFSLWGQDPANHLADGVFRRALKVDGRWWGYEIRWAGDADHARLMVSVPGAPGPRVLEAAVAEARWLCGADLDVESFYEAVREEPVLGGLTRRLYGLRPTLSPNPFEQLVGAVCAQQVNLTFAFAVRGRIVRRFGEAVRVGAATVHAFPEPARLARAGAPALRRLQLTTRKAEYIVGLARAVAAGALDLAALGARSNDEVIATITALRGFGRWSAEWFLARGLGRGDVCPAGDLGVRRAFERFYSRGRALSERAIRRRARAWGPHQNLAVHYLLAGERLTRDAAGGGA